MINWRHGLVCITFDPTEIEAFSMYASSTIASGHLETYEDAVSVVTLAVGC